MSLDDDRPIRNVDDVGLGKVDTSLLPETHMAGKQR